MQTRSAELQKKSRRIFVWSLYVAIALHVAAFWFWPAMTVDVDSVSAKRGAPQEGVEVQVASTYVEVLFGPPTIFRPDGTPALEPPERVLEAKRLLRLPTECQAGDGGGDGVAISGAVRLSIGGTGHVAGLSMVESTGSRCGDRVMRDVAAVLRYDWLPNQDFPAPVDLIQPVTISNGRRGVDER